MTQLDLTLHCLFKQYLLFKNKICLKHIPLCVRINFLLSTVYLTTRSPVFAVVKRHATN